mgnify:CR=1 FL=1
MSGSDRRNSIAVFNGTFGNIFDKLYDGNIIITKRLTDKLIEKLVENKEKCICYSLD